MNFQMFELDLEKADKPEITSPISTGLSKQQDSSRKTSISALLAMPKPLTVWITTNCENSSRDGNILPASWETCIQVKKQQLELEMKQWTGSKLGKQYVKAVYCHPAYLTCIQMYTEYIMWNGRLDESQAGNKFAKRSINNLR